MRSMPCSSSPVQLQVVMSTEHGTLRIVVFLQHGSIGRMLLLDPRQQNFHHVCKPPMIQWLQNLSMGLRTRNCVVLMQCSV
mmetsp:Transcript_106723/g.238180  ORF Transcript_106723/g.238180 Transcript_106723/m.238180 type:complete len:81 (+) Transcript_106723:46-288(+)